GNGLDNHLDGGMGNDTLNGGAGVDTLIGGEGNDNYFVDNAGDMVVELADAGIDTVTSTTDYTLGENLEHLLLKGSALLGAGNELNNHLTGNSLDNTLAGGAGSDVLVGDAGNDRYYFSRGDGADLLSEKEGEDQLFLGGGISYEQLWFKRRSSDLEVSVIGSTDKITVKNWYKDGFYQVEQFHTSDGKTLLSSQVQSLVDAMASFSPPAAGQLTLPEDYQSQLQPVLAANWK
ncbi:calcium-binding protein, partial [Pseudogulbenkiania subflava]